jgi:hypothetical protein
MVYSKIKMWLIKYEWVCLWCLGTRCNIFKKSKIWVCYTIIQNIKNENMLFIYLSIASTIFIKAREIIKYQNTCYFSTASTFFLYSSPTKYKWTLTGKYQTITVHVPGIGTCPVQILHHFKSTHTPLMTQVNQS